MHAGSGGHTMPGTHEDAGSVMHDDAGTGDTPGDSYGPWAGGATYYERFEHGPPSDAAFFPIAVWLQSPDRAQDYAAIGINTYIGLWEGPTEDQLSMLAAAKMPVACDQNDVGLAHVDDHGIIAWTQQDEPDNAQTAASGNGYEPCIPPARSRAATTRSSEGRDSAGVPQPRPGRRARLHRLGQRMRRHAPADYPEYLAGADIISFDIYPSNETADDVAGKLWFVAEGVKNLVTWSQGKLPVWNWIECTGIDDASRKPTPAQVKAEVWMSIVTARWASATSCTSSIRASTSMRCSTTTR